MASPEQYQSQERTNTPKRRSLPEGMLASPRLAEEFRERMREANTDDWEDVLYAELKQRYRALRAVYTDEKEFSAKLGVAEMQGRHWQAHRFALGLTHDQVAEQTGLSPWELNFIELGLPSPEGVPTDIAAKLDEVLEIPDTIILKPESA